MEGIGMLGLGLAIGWLTLAVGVLVYRWARKRWRTWRYGIGVDHSFLQVEFGRKMTHAPDRRALGDLLTIEIARALRAQRAALLLPAEPSSGDCRPQAVPDAYQLVDLVGGDLCLPLNHAAVRWVASAGEAGRSDRGRLRELIAQGQVDLDWTRVWVPLMRGINLRGLWLLGEREEGRQYAPEDLDWLTTVGRQAAVVLETIRYAERERQAATEMRTLYRQVVAAREVERGRMARELHDGVLQDLCAVTRDLKAVGAQIEANGAHFAGLAERAGETVAALRALCNDLRPPLLQRDLTSALRALVEELDARSPAPIHIDLSENDLRLTDDVSLAVFRITQEALHNAIQHADASEIAVRLTEYPDRLRLTVTDDGRGISGGVELARFVAQGHYGLAGMRERAAMIGGKLDVQTAVDYGTVVVLELPR
jgi:signal transduction histidine kinase